MITSTATISRFTPRFGDGGGCADIACPGCIIAGGGWPYADCGCGGAAIACIGGGAGSACAGALGTVGAASVDALGNGIGTCGGTGAVAASAIDGGAGAVAASAIGIGNDIGAHA